MQEAEAPPPDPHHGLRFHSWVLVLAGKREVAQSFFLEPTTGEPHPLDWEEYLGVESLWNHKNYWVNMQDCSQGVKVHSACRPCGKILMASPSQILVSFTIILVVL